MNSHTAIRQRFRAMFLAELDSTRERLASLPHEDPASAKPFADMLHQLIGATSAVELPDLGILCRYCEQGLRTLHRDEIPPSTAPLLLKLLPILDDVSEALHSDRPPDMAGIRALSTQLAPDPGP